MDEFHKWLTLNSSETLRTPNWLRIEKDIFNNYIIHNWHFYFGRDEK